MSPDTGRRIGPYEIQGRLGGGGMGHVFRAWDARLHREVAIKILHHEYAMAGMRERFLREARAASALNHPNICTVFDIGEQDGEPYLVMELLQGETLKDRILRSTIQVEELISIAKDVAEGLAAAHAKGIVHRDVKPANIFLVEKPNGKLQAKVLDFGLAKVEGGPRGRRERQQDITSVGATVGTLAYMSPEQARGEVLDLRSDLFSLGVVLYEMATRQTPFQGTTSALVFVQLLNHPPEPVRAWNDAIPRDLEKVILKLLAKERTARFQTANELEDALIAMGERPAGGGWLRKAIATVPLVRASDPVARERRAPQGRNPDSQVEADRRQPDRREPDRQAGDPPPGSTSSGQSHFLRPIARVPRPDSSPQTRSAAGAVESGPSTPAAGGGSREGRAANLSGAAASAGEPEDTARPGDRARYHPDHDALFGRFGSTTEESNEQAGSYRKSAVPGPRSPAGSPVLSSGRYGTALESASRRVPVESPAWSTRHPSTPELPWDVRSDEETRASQANGTQEVDWNEERVAERPAQPPHRAKLRRRPLWWIGGGLIATGATLAILSLLGKGHFGPALLTQQDSVLLAEIENRTGDRTLDGSATEGLRMDLEESPYVRLKSGEAYRAALRQNGAEETVNTIAARSSAERLGAKIYVYGSIVGASAPYTLHVDVMKASTNDAVASLDEHVASLQQIPGAIDRLAEGIRAAVGEGTDSINESHNPLSREATGNLEALHAYAQGENAMAAGKVQQGLGFYQEAVTLDPRFVQAQLRLVVLYRKQRAEVAAADAARLALASSETTSERTRTLASYEYEMNGSGDYARASELIRGLLKSRPHDSEALSDLARVVRLQGRLTDSLQAAEQAYAEDDANVDAYVQAANALIGLDRYDAALDVEQRAQRLGLARVGGNLIGAYLEDRQSEVDKALSDFESSKPGQRADWNFGLYLDNSGRLAEGLDLWRSSASAAERVKGLGSAAAYLLAQGAVDRAILGDCGNGLALARESAQRSQGVTALFNTGMTSALCGERPAAKQALEDLKRLYPRSTDVNGYLAPDLQAALDLDANDPAAALEDLRASRPYDLISLTPYLRGRAHVALRQVEIGIVDYQTVLSHRGITFIFGSDVYLMAEIGVARAFADTGDTVNSADAYRHFLQLWKDADQGQPLLIEAEARSK